MSVLLAVFLVLGCSDSDPPDPNEGGEEPTEQVSAEARALYQQCKSRVEGAETAGECSSDNDCAASGCSEEVCLPKAAAAGLNTPCEAEPCFEVLEACGCHDGRCTWSLKEPPAGSQPAPRKGGPLLLEPKRGKK